MFSWGPFPTAPAGGVIFYGAVIDPWTAWSVVLAALAVSCAALWALGNRSREHETTMPSDEITKKAA